MSTSPSQETSPQDETMGQEIAEADIYQAADAVIGLANEIAADAGSATISVALPFASARYAAFQFQAAGGEQEDVEHAIAYFANQYASMLRQHLGEIGFAAEQSGGCCGGADNNDSGGGCGCV